MLHCVTSTCQVSVCFSLVSFSDSGCTIHAEVEKLEDVFGCVILCRTLYLYSTSSVCSIGLLSMCQQQQSYFERRRCFFVYFSVCDTVFLVESFYYTISECVINVPAAAVFI